MALARGMLTRMVKQGLSTSNCLSKQVAPAIGIQPHRNFIGKPGREYYFRQLFDPRTFTYTYLLGDKESREAVIIDPVLENVDRDVQLVKELNLNLLYGINTHVHADHVSGTGEIKKRLPDCKSVLAERKAKADIWVDHKDVIEFGKFSIECRATPGHTSGCMTYVWHEKDMAFTGDALLIRGCGRTDFPQGNPTTLFESCHQQILSLPDSTLLYVGHDYKGRTATSVEEEKKHNLRLTKPLDEFITIMKNLKLPYPQDIDRALPANMNDGMEAVVEN